MAKPTKKSFPLRIDQPLYDAIERLAASELRSVNAQIDFMLRRGLERRGVDVAGPVRRRRGRPPESGRAKTGPDDQGDER